jgi:hypothetical protein
VKLEERIHIRCIGAGGEDFRGKTGQGPDNTRFRSGIRIEVVCIFRRANGQLRQTARWHYPSCGGLSVRPSLILLALIISVSAPLLLGSCSGDDVLSECELIQPDNLERTARDFQYARYRFFDVGKVGGITYLQERDTIVEFRLYEHRDGYVPELRDGSALVDYLHPEVYGDSIVGQFQELYFMPEYNLNPHEFYVYFTYPRPRAATTAFAYYMVVKHASGDTTKFGDVSGGRYRLQLLKPSTLTAAHPLWEAEWKNVYDLGIRSISYSVLYLDIFKSTFGGEDDPTNPNYQYDGKFLKFLQLLGLDARKGDGSLGSDGRIDDDPAILLKDLGLVIFPSRQPFADTTLSNPAPEVYKTDDFGVLAEASKYYLKWSALQYRKTIRLKRMNLVEGSELVIADGTELTRDVDYKMEYYGGELEFIDDSYLSIRALEVCYDYKPL